MLSTDPMMQQDEQQPSSVRDRIRRFSEKRQISQDENFEKKVKRNALQHGARAVETVLGMPGNFKKAYKESMRMINEHLPESLQKKQDVQNQEDKTSGLGVMGALFNPPTSQEIREKYTPQVAEKLGGNKSYLEPQGKGEEFAGNLSQDIISFFMPGTSGMRLMTRLGAPIAGNLAKEGVKYLGADEGTAEKTKLGFMLASTLAGQSNPGQFAGQRIAQAKAAIPDTATAPAGQLANLLLPLYNRMQRGLSVPSKSRANQGMRDLAGQVQHNRIPLRNLMDARDNVNEWITEAGGFDVPANIRDQTIRNLNELKRGIIHTIDSTMAQRFPEVGELYRSGYEAAAVNHQSNAISSFIEKNFGRKLSSAGAKLLFPALVGGAAALPKTAAMTAAAYPLYKGGQVLYRMANSPTLAQYYQDVISASTRGNVPAMVNSMQKLDKELKKEEEKQIPLKQFKSKLKKKD